MPGDRKPETGPRHPRAGSAVSTPSSAELEVLRGRVLAAVRRNCPPWMRDLAEDISQNVLVKLFRAIEKSEGKQTFSAVYLEKSAHGAVVDEIRRICRRREDSLEGDPMAERLSSGRDDPHQSSTALEIGRGIFDCLGKLNRSRRLAVTLYLNGCTVPEAANHLRWHLKKTESLVYRGLADLRGCLESKGLKP